MPNSSTTNEFASSLREASRTMRAVSSTLSALCPGGVCGVNNSGTSDSRGGAALHPGGALLRPYSSVITAALGGDMQRAVQGVLRGVIGRLAGGIGGAAGGGLGGSILASLVGGGLGLLASKLFKGGGLFGGSRLEAGTTVPLPSLLHFPQLTLPGFASAPASALFGQRAVPRSPGVQVTVEYKRGADDFVVAKVAQRLSELNSLEGI
jgi:hypothetical protein